MDSVHDNALELDVSLLTLIFRSCGIIVTASEVPASDATLTYTTTAVAKMDAAMMA